MLQCTCVSIQCVLYTANICGSWAPGGGTCVCLFPYNVQLHNVQVLVHFVEVMIIIIFSSLVYNSYWLQLHILEYYELSKQSPPEVITIVVMFTVPG